MDKSEKLDRAQKRDILKQSLLNIIQQNGEGVRLPSERELSEKLGVARETLRRCLHALEEEGVLQRKQGAGTFVSGQAWIKQFELISFSEDMRERGLTPSSEVLSYLVIKAGAKLAQKLKVMPGAPILEIRRLRLANEEPMALETVYLVQDKLPDFEPTLLASHSLYDLIERNYGLQIKSATQQIHATVLSEDEADLLDVAPFSPALLVERQVMTSNGDIFEYGKSVYRADRYRFEVCVLRPSSTLERTSDEGNEK
jgi:GntR family transcriptional regulator